MFRGLLASELDQGRQARATVLQAYLGAIVAAIKPPLHCLESPPRPTSIARLCQHNYQKPSPLLLFSSIFESPKISITAFRSNSPVNGSSQSLAIVSLKCCGAFRTLRRLEGDDGKCGSLIPVLSGLFHVIVNKAYRF